MNTEAGDRPWADIFTAALVERLQTCGGGFLVSESYSKMVAAGLPVSLLLWAPWFQVQAERWPC